MLILNRHHSLIRRGRKGCYLFLFKFYGTSSFQIYATDQQHIANLDRRRSRLLSRLWYNVEPMFNIENMKGFQKDSRISRKKNQNSKSLFQIFPRKGNIYTNEWFFSFSSSSLSSSTAKNGKSGYYSGLLFRIYFYRESKVNNYLSAISDQNMPEITPFSLEWQ